LYSIETFPQRQLPDAMIDVLVQVFFVVVVVIEGVIEIFMMVLDATAAS
jgi:hypothetical protein